MSPSRFRDRLVSAQNNILKKKDYIAVAHAELSFQPGAYRRPRRLPLIAAGIAVLAASAAVLHLIANSGEERGAATALLDGRPVSVGEWIFGSPDGEKTLRFPDGSSLSLEGSTGVRIHRLHSDGARLSLEHGGLLAHITHRETTSWLVTAGPFTIAVKGTRFDVDWSPERQSFRLDLREGAVRVTGPMLREGRLMKTGEKLLASLSEERIEIEDAHHIKTVIFNGNEIATIERPGDEDTSFEKSTNIPPIEDNIASASPPSVKKSPLSKSSKWRSLAASGKYEEAMASAKRFGVLDILKNESAATLMMLGDTARRTGEIEIAAKAYRAVRRRYAHTPHASGAAFSLGLMAFDNQRDYRSAAKWFDACTRSNPQGAFTREAAGRLMESLDRAGDPDGARAAARRYLARYPGGPHARLAEKLVAAN
jgi:transmembrane sensor